MQKHWTKKEITEDNFGSCTVWTCKAGGKEPKHYHNATEVTFVLKGNCKTHKQGEIYVYKPGDIHEVINDSKEDVVFIVTSFPPWSEKNTFYV